MYVNDLHPTTSTFATFWKKAYYLGIKDFNNFPANLKIVSNELQQFRPD
jgi:hypothetical protein